MTPDFTAIDDAAIDVSALGLVVNQPHGECIVGLVANQTTDEWILGLVVNQPNGEWIAVARAGTSTGKLGRRQLLAYLLARA